MKISKKTIDILKNFNIINSSIFIKGGNVISTISIADNVLANATIVEDFEKEFGIYDISFFLNTISLFDDPDLDFSNSGYVIISDDKASSEYKFADEKIIKYPPKDSIELGIPNLDFDISKSDMKSIMKASKVMGLKDIKIFNENGKIFITVFDFQDPLTNTYSIELCEYTGDNTFKLFLRVDNLIFVDGNYSVDVVVNEELNFILFSNNDISINYWVALESDSEFN